MVLHHFLFQNLSATTLIIMLGIPSIKSTTTMQDTNNFQLKRRNVQMWFVPRETRSAQMGWQRSQRYAMTAAPLPSWLVLPTFIMLLFHINNMVFCIIIAFVRGTF
jgi:hypothetical protein